MPEHQLHALRQAAIELQRCQGERQIAAALGINRTTWRRIADRLGVPAESVGRRPGSAAGAQVAPAPAVVADRSLDDPAVRHRVRADRRHRNFAPRLLATRVRAAHDADLAHDVLAYEDALIDLGSWAFLAREHSRDLRRAT